MIRFSAIGDCVITAWPVSALRKALPEAQIVWAVQERCSDVILSPGLVDEKVLADRDRWKAMRWSPLTWNQQLRAFIGLRRYQFDVGFDFQGHGKTAACLKISGAKLRLTNRGTDPMAKKMNTLVECGVGKVHEVEAGFRLVSSWHKCELPERPMMPCPGTGQPSDTILIQTGSGHPTKTVRIETWQELARQLLAKGHKVVSIGGPRDPKICVDGIEENVGKLSLVQTLALIRSAKLHVSADTGTAHISAAYGIPTVTVFGPMDPVRFRPYSDAGEVLRNSNNPNDVTCDEILSACEKSLGGRLSAS